MPRTLAQNASYIKDTIKPAIKSAIEAQGVTVPSTDSFLDYADRIGEIEGGGSGYQLKDLPTGSISTVNDAAELPLNALKVSVEAWQEGSGDPSPSNVRPIHGWSTATITTDAGANLLGDANNWNINASGSIVSSGSYSTYTAQVEQGCSYKLTQTGTGNIVYAFYSNNPAIGSSSYNSSRTVVESANTAVITAPISGYVAIRTDKNTVSNQALKRANVYTHAFTDAQGNPLTVYGAEWNVVNGELEQTDGYIVFDGSSDEGWALETGGKRVYSGMLRGIAQGKAQGIADITSNQFEAITSARTLAGNEGISIDGSGWLCVADGTGAMSVADWNTYLSEHPLQVRYKLITPTTTQLSPLSIRLLEGTNNVFADCGEVIEGEYFVGSSGAYDLYDYIQSDGTQYINTGRKLSSGDVIRCLYVPQSGNSNWNYVWASYDNSTVKGGLVFISNNIKAQYINGSEANRESYSNGTFYEDTLTMTADSNGDTYVFSYSADTACCSYMRLYAFSINGDDYLPCKRRSDGKFGLYDVANSTFLTDSASGNAITGGNNLGVRIG